MVVHSLKPKNKTKQSLHDNICDRWYALHATVWRELTSIYHSTLHRTKTQCYRGIDYQSKGEFQQYQTWNVTYFFLRDQIVRLYDETHGNLAAVQNVLGAGHSVHGDTHVVRAGVTCTHTSCNCIFVVYTYAEHRKLANTCRPDVLLLVRERARHSHR